jgi:hypothetical protein
MIACSERLIAALLVVLILASGCNIFNDPDEFALRGTTDGFNDSDIADVGDMTEPRDMGAADADDIADTSDMLPDADMELVIDPATVFDLLAVELCDYYRRVDYHAIVFIAGFRDYDGCIKYFELFLKPLFGTLLLDVVGQRASLNEQVVRDTVEFARTDTGDPRGFPIKGVNDLISPLTANGGACAGSAACVPPPGVDAACFLADPADCTGECVVSYRVCGQNLCGPDEWCFMNVCVPFLQDGEACGDDFLCLNRCISGVCGSLAVGEDCTGNEEDCGAGRFCKTDEMPPVCTLSAVANEACVEDQDCVPGHYCDAATLRCVATGEGTPCQGTFCGSGRNCLQTSAADTETACFAPRPLGEYCASDGHCEAGLYCNLNACTTAKGDGETCRGNRECESVCRKALAGDDTGLCATFEWGLQVGEQCHRDAAACGMPLECVRSGDVLSGLCTASSKPAVGEACSASLPYWCADDTVCVDGLCQAVKDAGEPCIEGKECLSAVCQDMVCYDRYAECVGQ